MLRLIFTEIERLHRDSLNVTYHRKVIIREQHFASFANAYSYVDYISFNCDESVLNMYIDGFEFFSRYFKFTEIYFSPCSEKFVCSECQFLIF